MFVSTYARTYLTCVCITHWIINIQIWNYIYIYIYICRGYSQPSLSSTNRGINRTKFGVELKSMSMLTSRVLGYTLSKTFSVNDLTKLLIQVYQNLIIWKEFILYFDPDVYFSKEKCKTHNLKCVNCLQ